MDKKLIKESLELCIKAIRILHPNLDPDEPCIAWEAFESAQHALDSFKHVSQQPASADSTAAFL